MACFRFYHEQTVIMLPSTPTHKFLLDENVKVESPSLAEQQNLKSQLQSSLHLS